MDSCKCTVCKRKIAPLMKALYMCRCQNIYCRVHLQDHPCEFDYKALFQEQMKEKLPVVVNPKVVKSTGSESKNQLDRKCPRLHLTHSI